jgi:acyl carrier protein
MIIKDRVKNIISNVFNYKIEEIKDDTSMTTIQSWNSLNHLNLILTLEDEFDIELTIDETVKMLDFLSIVEIIDSKINI